MARLSRNWLEKPCERQGCTSVIYAPGPKTLAKRRFCSCRCQYEHRHAAGWPHYKLTREDRRRGGQKGGMIAGRRRRKEAMLRRASTLRSLITDDIREALAPEQLARITALLVRAYMTGEKRGYHAGWMARHLGRAQRRAA